MTAIPKRNDQRLWSKAEATSSALISPPAWSPGIPKTLTPSSTRERVSSERRSLPGILIAHFVRLEKPISIVAIVAFLILASVLSHGALTARTEIRETRVTLERLVHEISFLGQELQDTHSELESFDAPESEGTLPIEPGDVVTVALPSAE